MDLLRIFTAGNVDDGKSTMIGRLLHDTDLVMTDQMEAIEKASKNQGLDSVNLALITDGLKDERDQGITIDVAYRYFASERRKFILADTPGHFQYTRNMVTGASTANLAIVLVDARHGLVEQTKRHCFIASLLRIPHLVICINKMDLVNYSQEIFEDIREDFEDFSGKLEIHDVTYIPISALKGGNVVKKSEAMSWYDGKTLLKHLEDVHIASDRNLIDFRLPIQMVLNSRGNTSDQERAFAGTIASGSIKPGEDVEILPLGFKAKIKSLRVHGQDVEEAFAPQSVSVTLDKEIDVARGNMLVRVNNRPDSLQEIDAMVCWMDQTKSMKTGTKYRLLHTTNESPCMISDLLYTIDVNSLSKNQNVSEMSLNEIGKVRIKTAQPILADLYRTNRSTGSFVIVDEASKVTVGAGMIV